MNEEQPAVDPAAAAFDDYSDVVLYDVMYETGTQLGGTLVALHDQAAEAGNAAATRHWLRRDLALQREREAVDPNDREAQVSAITAWRDEMTVLRPFLPNP